MGQLIIRYNLKNPGTREIKAEVNLAPNDMKEVAGQPIQELELEDEMFVRKETKKQQQ